MAVYSARQSSYSDGDTITAAHTNDEFNAILAAFHVSTGHTHDGSTAGDGGPLSTLYSNAISFGTGADTDIVVTFNANTSDGVITWMEDEDFFKFSDAITVGVDDTGYDVKFFGATSGSYFLWDESADSLLLTDSTPLKIGDSQDMTLYHDGSNSYITNAVGALKIATGTSGIAVTIGHTTSEVTVADNLTVTGTLTLGSGAELTEAELEFLDGITAGTVAASKAVVVDSNKDIGTFRNVTIDGTFSDGNYTFDTSGNVSGLGTIGSGAITSSSTVQGTTITATTAFVPDASDGAALGTSSLEFSDLFLADGAVVNFGDDQDVSLTHVVDTGLLLSSTDQLQFGDSGTYIYQSADGVLDLVSDTEIEINATTIDINGAADISGNLDVGGTLGVTGVATFATHVALGDSDQLKLGDSTDLQIYHDGTNSYVANKTGALKLATETSGIAITIGHTTSEVTIADNLTTTGNLSVGGNFDVTGTLDFSDSAITNAGDIQLDSITGDGDTNTSITFSGSDVITITAGGDTQVTFNNGSILPTTDNDIDLGSGSYEFKDAYFDGTVTTDGLTVSSTTNLDGAIQVDNTITVGADDTGYDVQFFGDTASAYMLWDTSADDLVLAGAAGIDLAGDIDVDGTTNLDNTDIDGTFAVDGTTISLDATTSLNIDNSNTSNGITIATATSGVPISIGHSTSETTINDNATVTGNLSVGGDFDVTGSFDMSDADITNIGSIALDTITNDGTDITLDSSGDIILDAAGDTIFLKDAGTTFGSLDNTSGNLIIKSGTTTALTFSGANVTLAGDLTISGDDITMGTNTNTAIMVADGTNFNPVVPSGDVGVTNAGVFSIASGVVVNADIHSSAAIADSKLATISTAGKVDIGALEIDGATDIGAALADADLIIVDDGAGGTERKAAMSRVATYIEDNATLATPGFAVAMAIAL